ncbi:MAG: hypothetical protein Q9159_000887 [Coniocarpon cinnabarinum]
MFSAKLVLVHFIVMASVSATSETIMTGFVQEPDSGRGTIGILWQCIVTVIFHGLNVTWSWPKFCIGSSLSLKQSFFLISNGLKVKFKENREEVWFNPSIGDFWALPESDLEAGSKDLQRFLGEVYERLHTDIDNEFIDAQSHTDYLSKVVTCSQATWTGIQIIARLAQGLDVSLAEVVTSGYIIMALLTYFFWFCKPYNIGTAQEIYINDEFAQVVPRTKSKPGAENGIDQYYAVDNDFSEDGGSDDARRVVLAQEYIKESKEQSVEEESDRTKSDQVSHRLPEENSRAEQNLKSEEGRTHKSEYQAISHGVKEGAKEPPPYRACVQIIEKVFGNVDGDENVRNQAFRFPYLSWLGPGASFALAIILTPIPWVALAGVHLGAWGYDFPTVVEMWMWRVSGIFLFAG